LVAGIERHLLERDTPRLSMFAIVAVTAVAGMLANVALFDLGLGVMWLRYGLSVATAYGAFMVLIWLWIGYRRHAHSDENRGGSVDHLGDIDVSPAADRVASSDTSAGDGGGLGDLGFDELVVVMVILAAIASAVAAAAYVVFIAPSLLAELLLDGVVAGALYRKLRRQDRRHWLESAISKTIAPAAVVAVFFVITGFVCQSYAPGATTLGDTWRQMQEP
jgi:hypothetical protein